MAQIISFSKFGSGKNGSPAVSGTINTYASCTGTATQTSLTTELSASAGDIILIHQSQGTGVGQWELNYVLADEGATLTLGLPLAYSYTTGAQAVLVPQYTGGTLSGAVTGTAWNGTVGGIIALMSNGALTISGSLNINGGNGVYSTGNPAGGTGGGFRGGAGNADSGSPNHGYQGEGHTGIGGTGADAYVANGNGGGTGVQTGDPGRCYGGGGSNGGAGSNGSGGYNGTDGYGATTVTSTANLTTMTFGGGGGGGAREATNQTGSGAAGSGIVFIVGREIVVSGSIVANGGEGGGTERDGGGGAGGSILIKAGKATLGTNLVTATGGNQSLSGTGGAGRIHLDYYGAYTGTTTPTLDVAQDTTLTPPIHGGMI